MLSCLPSIIHEQTPINVETYLAHQGWYKSVHGSVEYWMSHSTPGYFRWEQALAYTLWSKLHLGVV